MAEMNHITVPGEALEERRKVISSFAELGARLRTKPHDADSTDQMIRSIEGEILPRLMLAFQMAPSHEGDFITDDDRAEFIQSLLKDSASALSDFVERLIARGVPIESVFADLLATSARRLGEMWERDLCDFTDVTVGLCRLHEVLRHNSVVGDAAFLRAEAQGPAILLTTACADQHVFGLLMVAEFFRRDGWRVWSEPGASLDSLEDIVRHETIDMIGVSVSRTVSMDQLQEEIARLRSAACNSDLKILVGGQLFLSEPGLVQAIGADGWAQDALSAPQTGRELLADVSATC